jgi:diacylglycerol kinase (ATP)
MKGWLSLRFKSFRYAVNGLVTLVASQPNAQIHVFATLLVVALGLHLGISAQDWAVLVLTIALVMAMEALNTSLEFICDALYPHHHPLIGKAKDVAAAAVLISSIAAALVGGLIFFPALVERYLI